MTSPSSANPLPQSLRQALWPLSLLYGAVASLRNSMFALGCKRVHRLSVPVVSIGNLTVGGTGKTPAVAWLCQLAKDAGKVPGVLARGYGRAPGAELNDEGVLLQRRLPFILQEQDPDRVAAGARLVAKGADFIVLDDGFQHRRLHRDLNVVCLDALLPFANGNCLPAGDLREFRSGLRRADCLLLTRAGDLSQEQIAQRVDRLVQIVGRQIPIHFCEHQPTELIHQPSGERSQVSSLRGRPVVLLSAIAKPQSFRSTVEKLGGEIVAEIVYRDHHQFTLAEVEDAVAKARAADACLLTTEKDDARLDEFDIERFVLQVDLAFLSAAPRTEDFLL